MSDPSSPIDPPPEWHALLGGERRGPFSRAGLRALLDAHPDGWTAPVWRLGMIDWRAASSVTALTATAPASQPPLVRTSSPLEDPPRVSAPRNTAGELRVLSYGELKALVREVRVESAPPAPSALQLELPEASTPSSASTSGLAVSSEWSTVGTSELAAIGTSELRAMGLSEAKTSETSEWAAVGTSELRAVGTSELRALVLVEPSAAKTVHELPALKASALRDSALPSMMVSDQTATELPSFNFRSELRVEPEPPARAPDPVARARQTATPTPRSLPAQSLKPASPAPSRAPYVMAGLLVISATAFGSVLTVRSLRAHEAHASQGQAYHRAPPPPAQPPPLPVAARPVAALPAAASQAAFETIGSAATPERAPEPASAPDTAPAEPRTESSARRAAQPSEPAEAVATRNVDSVRVSATSAPVRVGNHAQAKVVCTLPQGTARSVLTVLPGAQGRWFAVHCDDQSVGWVNEQDVAKVER